MLRQQVRFGQGRDAADYHAGASSARAAHRAIAREAAEKSIVLLKNEGGLLPLAGDGALAVIGRARRHAQYRRRRVEHDPSRPCGDAAGGPARGARQGRRQPRRRQRPRSAPPAAAGEADAALVVVGYTHADEGEFIPPNQLQPYADLFPPPADAAEKVQSDNLIKGMSDSGFSTGGDRLRLTLRPEDEALIAAVAAANPRTIVAVMAGSAVIMEAWRHAVPAILMLWYPGQEGGHALADILTGKVNPSGRLPCTFPASADQLPFFDRDATAITYDLWHGYRKLLRDGNAPAFPFGFGLSYTTFAHANLRLATDTLAARRNAGGDGRRHQHRQRRRRRRRPALRLRASAPRSSGRRAN